ncbi:MAG: hypothetical protein ACXVDB_05120 [Tumebacillaceae bacterium]
MYVISVFEHQVKLEMAIGELEELGIRKEQILAVPLIKKEMEKKYFDPFDTEGISLFGATALGTIGMLVGVIVGYVWTWGPVIWGLIGLVGGILLGLLVDRSRKQILDRLTRKRSLHSDRIDVVLHVHCNPAQVERVEQILWKFQALGLARLERGSA